MCLRVITGSCLGRDFVFGTFDRYHVVTRLLILLLHRVFVFGSGSDRTFEDCSAVQLACRIREIRINMAR